MESRTELDPKLVRKTYLITYSQAVTEKCPDRETFSKLVLESFQKTTKTNVKPVQWVVCQETHESGGYHYHMSIKFDGNIRWNSAKTYLLNTHNISVNFKDGHPNYISAYRYLKKTDKSILRSPNHPDLDLSVSPPTSKATKALIAKRRSKGQQNETTEGQPPKKCKRLTKSNVMDIIKAKNIKTETELLALASTQADNGLNSLKDFIANTPERVYRELLTKTWKMAGAENVLKRQNQNRMDRLNEVAKEPCVASCNDKQWLKMEEQVLKKNKVNKYVFADLVRNILEKGRGKGRNLMITGPTNCGKTFILNPLTLIFKTFVNPSSAKYAFVGMQECELMLLNDFRWSQDMIPWQEFLNLLEGQTVHLAAPKTHFAQDIMFTADTPIFSTSIEMVKFAGKSNLIQGENAMMERRWTEIKFHAQIAIEEQIEIQSCPRCFAELVFAGFED